ncbi:MAG: hypothetical protein ACI8TX_002444 [Hyphomicrobiaceae bacterium]|jgi:hypothetical protein
MTATSKLNIRRFLLCWLPDSAIAGEPTVSSEAFPFERMGLIYAEASELPRPTIDADGYATHPDDVVGEATARGYTFSTSNGLTGSSARHEIEIRDLSVGHSVVVTDGFETTTDGAKETRAIVEIRTLGASQQGLLGRAHYRCLGRNEAGGTDFIVDLEPIER